MEIIKNGDKKVVGIISKKSIPKDAIYRVSGFVYPYTENGVYLLINTLTGQVAKLNENEWKTFEQLEKRLVSYTYISESGLTELANLRFIVENDYSEAEQYKQVIEILNMMNRKKPGLKTYTILPTTGCNARCIYCYEQGIKTVKMTRKTADRLIEYICEKRCDDEIKLSWFGGEPLLGHETISYICQALRDREVPFRSEMVTNATLMTREMAHTAKTLWNLKKMQISLDGMPEDYEKRKKYYLPDKHNHETVIRAIHYLADEGIEIQLRVNFDRENISRMKNYLDFLKAEFGEDENISVYLSLLSQEKYSDKCVELYHEMFELQKYMRQIGIKQSSKKIKKLNIKLNYCMADSMDSSIVIDPQGNFYHCEHLPDNQSWGNIFDGCTDKGLYEKLKKPSLIDEKCKICTFLPYCTPFYKQGCPGWFDHCIEYMSMKTEYSLSSIISSLNKETQQSL